MERHHSRRTAWPGSTTLVALGYVQQEDNDKDCRQDASVPKIQFPVRSSYRAVKQIQEAKDD
jgi:hypothetical protein